MKNRTVVVAGAGISGLSAALHLAEKGCRVILADPADVSGGILPMLDIQFPNDHCGMCRILPMIEREGAQDFCLKRGVFHDNIEFLPFTRVSRVQGSPGALEVTLSSVDPDKSDVVLDTVAAVIIAGGGRLYDPKDQILYDMKSLKNVMTALDFEKLTAGSIDYQEQILRPSDNAPAKKIAWVQCVGSRNLLNGSPFCASACCMFAVKEACHAKRVTRGQVETVIFYMDMRTFGREFQKYRDHAEADLKVKFVRSRVHSIEAAETKDDVAISYVDDAGFRHTEIFNMAVLSTGKSASEKEQESMDALALADGVFVLASATEFRDIAEAVKGAQAVISEVESLLRHLPEPQTGDQEESLPPAVDPAVFADRPSLLVVGVTRSRDLEDVPWETIKTRAESALCLRMEMMETLDDETLLQLRSLITENSINRVAIASENPSISLPSRKKLSELLGLPINFISIADLSPYFTTPDSTERLEVFILSRIETAVRFLKQARLYAQTDRTIVKKALIIGGGPAGLAAAKAVSDSGFESVILEKEDAVGGNIAEITGVGNQERLKTLVSGVKNDKQIQCLTGYTLKEHTGHAGVFKAVAVSGTGDPKIINHGALIIATGGKLNKPVSYLAGQNEKISGIADFRKQLEAGETDPASISTMGIILCTDSRENPFNYCSRICCMKSLETAILLKEKNPVARVFIFYRDIMTYGKSEALYTEARQKGVLFVQYDTNEKPRVSMDAGGLTLKARDRFSGFDLELALDILCLAPGVVPASIKSLASLLNLGLTDEGFIREADPKWRPVDTGREGIFIAGLARAPGRINEILEDGQAAAARAVRILQRNRLSPSAVVARVKDRTCSRCGICIETCPYGARYHSMVDDRVVVDPAACQGCGSCAVACPNSATVISGFEDQAILDALESVF